MTFQNGHQQLCGVSGYTNECFNDIKCVVQKCVLPIRTDVVCVCTCAAPPCCGAVNPAAGSFPGCCAPVAPAVGCFPVSELHTPSCSAPVWPSAWPGSPGASHSPSACLEEIKVVNLVKYVIPRDKGKIFRVLQISINKDKKRNQHPFLSSSFFLTENHVIFNQT